MRMCPLLKLSSVGELSVKVALRLVRHGTILLLFFQVGVMSPYP